MLQLDGVTVAYGSTLALDLSTRQCVLESATSVAIMGPNGSGKTTLLKLLAGLLPPTSGQMSGSVAPVAYVGQHQHQHDWMPITAGEVISTGRFGRRGLLGRMKSEDRAAVAEAADRMSVRDLSSESFGELSGGQRQRVLIAAALAGEPNCLLLDEPITGLDLASQKLITDMVTAERDAGHLVAMSTHHMAEAETCDRVLLLDTKLIADGSPEAVLTPEHLSHAFGVHAVSASPTDGSLVLFDDHGHHHDH